ncbi:MAG: hypothetical protein WD875_19420 [Pirellulales bacterium]
MGRLADTLRLCFEGRLPLMNNGDNASGTRLVHNRVPPHYLILHEIVVANAAFSTYCTSS